MDLKRTAACAVVCVFFAAVCGAITLDESPAEPRDWGYRPAEGAEAGQNPPAFTWRPVKGAEAYVLEVASGPDFEEVVYTVERTPWNAHCPWRVFEPGAYSWRYAALDDGNRSGWSKARSFTVGEGLPVFPKPPLDELFARIPETHPRLFLRPEEVDRFRELAEGPLQDKAREIRASADKLLKSPPDATEPPKYPEGTEYKSKEWKTIWWGNRRRAVALTNGAATLAFAYLLDGKQEYGEAARDLMMAFCAWDPKGSTNYRYNDEAAMPLLYYPSRAYTWAHDMFTEEEREKVRAVMRVRGNDCYRHLRGRRHLWSPYASHSNRAWHWLGEVAVAFKDEIPEAGAWLDYIMTIFTTCYPVWGGADGGWHEGVAYWSSYISRFMYWAAVSQAAFDIDPFDKPFFHQTGYYGMYTCPPGTRVGAFGDQVTSFGARNMARLMGQLAAGARNPHWQWFAEQHGVGLPGGYFGFITGVRARGLETEAPDGLPTSRVFEGTGLAVLNTHLLDGARNMQVHFKSSPFGRQSHGYNANNAFLLNMGGQRVFLRTGRRDVYGSPHHKEWMWETKSDNAILVNGRGQPPHSPSATGAITAFHTSPQIDAVVGEAGASYANLDRWSRRILFFKPETLVIHDLLEAPEPSTYQWLLHAPGEFEVREQGARWAGEPGVADVAFVYPQGLEITQTGEFDTPPHEWAHFKLNEWHLTAAVTEKAARQEFLTVIRLEGTETQVKAQKTQDGFQLEVTQPAGETAVELGTQNVMLRRGNFEKRLDTPRP